MIDSLKAYLEKEQAHDPTIEEKYFISLLLDRIIDKIKDQLRNASSPFQAFVSSQDDNWKRNQYKALSEKLYRNGDNNFLDLWMAYWQQLFAHTTEDRSFVVLAL